MTSSDQRNQNDVFVMKYARNQASLSTRPVKVGAAIANSFGSIISSARNQLSGNLSESEGQHSRTVHAEIAAILRAGEGAGGSVLYVTCPVCHHCAALVIHAGISRVVTLPPPDGLADWYEASFAAARAMFAEAGVECVEIAE